MPLSLGLFVCFHRYLALYALLERYERLRSHNSRYILKLAVEQVHKLLIVAGIQFYEHCIRPGSEVTLHYLGDVAQPFHHFLVHASTFERDADIRTCGISETLGVYIKSAAHYHIAVYQMLHTLMYGCTRHTAFRCHILKRDAGVFDRIFNIFLSRLSIFSITVVFCLYLSLCNDTSSKITHFY